MSRLLGPPRFGLGVPGRVTIPLGSRLKPGAGRGHGARAKPAAPRVLFPMGQGGGGGFAGWKRPPSISLPGGEAQDRVRLCLSKNLPAQRARRRPPAFPPLLPGLENPSASTQRDASEPYGQRETVPRGEGDVRQRHGPVPSIGLLRLVPPLTPCDGASRPPCRVFTAATTEPGVSQTPHAPLKKNNKNKTKPVSSFLWCRSTTFETVGDSCGSLKIVLSSYIFIFVVFSY